MEEADVLVVGAGIAGIQSSLDMADQGYRVLLVEKQPSIGGRMISLSKVYPTLDCASCITTPRMASVAHHSGIKIYTWSNVVDIRKEEGDFIAKIVKKPRYVNEAECISCRRCEEVCPVYVPDEFEQRMGARKAISIPFTNAIPQLPVMDTENCILCGSCARACPRGCIDFSQEPQEVTVRAKAVIIATGYGLSEAKKEYGGGALPNVISPLQMERILAPHGPFGRVLRPSDGKIPDSIAFIQCAGSRDRSIGIPYCSRVCCMYAIKQAMLLSGSLPVADIVIYYMDIRAFGKGYEQFFQSAKAMGIQFVKAKAGKITEDEEHNPIVRIERLEEGGGPEDVKHDLVVLSLGLVPGCTAGDPALCGVGSGEDGFVASPFETISPTLTTIDGVFAAGTAIGPKDIVDTIMDAGSAAIEAINYLEKTRDRGAIIGKS